MSLLDYAEKQIDSYSTMCCKYIDSNLKRKLKEITGETIDETNCHNFDIERHIGQWFESFTLDGQQILKFTKVINEHSMKIVMEEYDHEPN
jgi:hypothetical protein